MKIINRYIIREIIKYSGIVMVTVVGIFLSVELFERLDNFMEAKVPLTRMWAYLFYKIPFVISLILPLSLLLGVLITIGLMGKNNELTAIKSCGISTFLILKPIFFTGLFFTFLLFVFAEIIVPVSSAKMNRIWFHEVQKRSFSVSREKNVWLKGDHTITYIEFYDKKKKTIHGLTVYFFGDNFKMIRRLDAKKAKFDSGNWIITSAMDQILDKKTGDYKIIFHDRENIRLDFSPENLESVVIKSNEMGLFELGKYIKKIEKEGYDATTYKVDFHAKIAFPFVCTLLGITGMGIASRKNAKEGLALIIAYGMGIAFLYWIIYSFCISIGYGGVLSPPVAAWTANFIFACVALFTILNIES